MRDHRDEFVFETIRFLRFAIKFRIVHRYSCCVREADRQGGLSRTRESVKRDGSVRHEETFELPQQPLSTHQQRIGWERRGLERRRKLRRLLDRPEDLADVDLQTHAALIGDGLRVHGRPVLVRAAVRRSPGRGRRCRPSGRLGRC